jgi:hypothetical protein
MIKKQYFINIVALILVACFGSAYAQNPLGNLSDRLRAAKRDLVSQLGVSSSAKSNVSAQMTLEGDAESIAEAISNIVNDAKASKDFMTDATVSAERSIIKKSADLVSEKFGGEVKDALNEMSKGSESLAKAKLIKLAESKQDFTAAAMIAIILDARETKGQGGSTSGSFSKIRMFAEQKNPVALFYYGRWLVLNKGDRLGAEYLDIASKAGHWGASLTETFFLSNGENPYVLDVELAIEKANLAKARLSDQKDIDSVDRYIAQIRKNEMERDKLKAERLLAHRQKIESLTSQNRKNGVLFYCEDKFRNGLAQTLAKALIGFAASRNQSIFPERMVRPPFSEHCSLVTGNNTLSSSAIQQSMIEFVTETTDTIYFTATSGRNTFGVISTR